LRLFDEFITNKKQINKNLKMETNKKTKVDLLYQYAVEAKQEHFRKVSLGIILFLGALSEIIRYLYFPETHWRSIIFVAAVLIVIVYIISVFITVANEKAPKALARTRFYIEKQIRRKNNEYIRQKRRWGNPNASKSQVHKILIEIKESRAFYKDILQEISVLLA
jgi:hypothetical protein